MDQPAKGMGTSLFPISTNVYDELPAVKKRSASLNFHSQRVLAHSITRAASLTSETSEIPKATYRFRIIFGLSIIFCIAGLSVCEQQMAKQANTATFRAPFFFLWYSTLIRCFTYPAYLACRLMFEFTRRKIYRWRNWKNSEMNSYQSQTSEFYQSTASGLWRDAKNVFGPNNFTVESAAKYIVPYVLIFIVSNGLFYVAVSKAPVSECVTVASSHIVFVHIISWIFLKEQFLIFKLFAVLICMGGIAFTAYASGTKIQGSSDSLVAAIIVTGSSLSSAIQATGFKRFLGSPNVTQIALFMSLSSVVGCLITWPVFIGLRLAHEEVWDAVTLPVGLMSASGALSSGSSIAYYLGISVVSPVLVSLVKPIQIVLNNGIDLGIRGLDFGLFNAIGTGLVIVGFLMLLVPNELVNIRIRAFVTWLCCGRTAGRLEEEEEVMGKERSESSISWSSCP
ncbi:hypothetical protein BV898_07176 [Hypsibius exemplaris]|uniref:EamA domain-containing protein n=1 Tax=Hypsibius exemplaris TaxID=2072580 RepID=A0A1W0WU99_HYPEX|nr:hypothetical protein BV898_07176 [Hypsibius exemplaris]